MSSSCKPPPKLLRGALSSNFESYEEDKERRLGEDAVLPKRIKYKKFARA